MRILAIFKGYYGERIINNIKSIVRNWQIYIYKLNVKFPKIIEDPELFIIKNIEIPNKNVDLLLYMPEEAPAFTILPTLIKMCDIKNVIAPIDDYNWLPRGIEKQILDEIENFGCNVIFPRPFCSLSKCNNDIINMFASKFGLPRFRVKIKNNRILSISIIRNTPCGSSKYVSTKIVGLDINTAPQYAGLYTQLYPCLASHVKDPYLGKDMIHLSASIMSKAVESAIKDAINRNH